MTEIKATGDEGMLARVHLWSDLAAVKLELLKRIQVLAQKSDAEGLIKVNDWLRNCLSIEKRHCGLLNEASAVVVRGRELASPTVSAGHPGRESDCKETDDYLEGKQDPLSGEEIRGGKARGRECRSAFVKREVERGNPLRRVTGQLCRDSSGVLVGIAYGAERQQRKNTWFLGLPAGQFKSVVLLCESLAGKIWVFRLPPDFVGRYGRHLSVSKQFKQAKFRLDMRDGRFELSTGAGPVDVGEFLDSESLVCPEVEYA